MRKRLIVAFVTLAVTIIALYGIPRAFMVAEMVQAAQTQQVGRLAGLLAAVVTERGQAVPVTEEFLQPLLGPGESVTYISADGEKLVVGEPAAEDAHATEQLVGGGSVTLTRSSASLTQRIVTAVLPVVLLGIALLIGSVIAAILLARALSRPFVRLAETARELGRGGLHPERERMTIPEARAIDEALRESAETLEHRIRREHEFAANASHQLRTPITALRLELEDLSLWPETPPKVGEQLGHALTEIDRLADAISQLLQLARGEAPGSVATEPLDGAIRAAAERWSAQATSAGRTIRVEKVDAGLGSAATAASQILDVLLHNALAHGRGTVTITGTRRTDYVTVQVSDEGPRPSGNAVFQRRPEQRSTTSGEGIGLALAAELAESLGGHLLLDGDTTTTFSLILPARD
ncbi:signal transduction histidine kinase [Microbacterium sp. W4I4]|uniref:sensor histidine kinase n=1 Tax=Microbacterium sp. W4I4 TaxID=3042295 RepID=UPI00278A99AA|nr:HAMP domain-containing sensor histidine kinase [Microbacterium sp. W4I4]MDQ0614814.1 signal transduction histidine kinase [Microbacterium sp. W4I4]